MSYKITPSGVPHAQYRMLLLDQNLTVVAERRFQLGFEGIGRHGTWASEEEYFVARKAREMFRDAAYAAGKWPTKEELLNDRTET